MSTTDYLVLVGIAVTAVGWVVTFLRQMAIAQAQAKFNGEVQRQLQTMQHDFEIAREARQLILSGKVTDLKLVADWLRDGFRLGSEIRSMSIRGSRLAGTSEWAKEFDRLTHEYDKWRNQYSESYSIVFRAEPPDVGGAAQELWRNRTYVHAVGEVPVELRHMVYAFDDVLASLYATITLNVPDDNETAEIYRLVDIMDKLYVSGTEGIERIQIGILTGTSSSTSRS